MGNYYDCERKRAVEVMSMLRALYGQKLALDYEISVYRMQENFENFSISSMQEQENMHFYTIVARKIIELHSVIGHVRMYGRKNPEVSMFLMLLQRETEKTENWRVEASKARSYD